MPTLFGGLAPPLSMWNGFGPIPIDCVMYVYISRYRPIEKGHRWKGTPTEHSLHRLFS